LRRNCLLKHVVAVKIEERVEVMKSGGRKGKQLLDGLIENRWYWILKEEALDLALWRNCFGRGYGPVVRRTAECLSFKSTALVIFNVFQFVTYQ